MTALLIIIAALILALIIFGLIIKSQRKYKKQAALEKYKKETLKKSIDNILLFQEDQNEIEKQTAKHVEILRKAKDEKTVNKELTILRDNIFAEYGKLRND